MKHYKVHNEGWQAEWCKGQHYMGHKQHRLNIWLAEWKSVVTRFRVRIWELGSLFFRMKITWSPFEEILNPMRALEYTGEI